MTAEEIKECGRWLRDLWPEIVEQSKNNYIADQIGAKANEKARQEKA